jgi:hypothetical protein
VLTLNDVVIEETKQDLDSSKALEDDQSRVLVAPTNLSANSAEVNVES